ncbi:site-specific integrase, partial [Enterococcus faecalis]|nr:site-specific integrase [Enterococcus faecalis]
KLTVNKTLYRENNQNFITTPKTVSSYRTIMLDTKCIELLKSFKIKKIEHSLKSNAFILNKEFVFTDSKGDFLKQCNYRT